MIDLDHVDIVTELGCELKHPIPKGDDFVDWIADERTQAQCINVLLQRGFSWEEIAQGFCDLTRWRWLPPVEQLQRTYEMTTAQ